VRVFTRVGGGQLARTPRANAICNLRARRKGASGAFFSLCCTPETFTRFVCMHESIHTLWGMRNKKKTSCGGVPCSCHCPWLEAGRGRRRSLTCWAGGLSGGLGGGGRGLHQWLGRRAAAADSARHPLLIWGDIHQRRRQLPPASPTQ